MEKYSVQSTYFIVFDRRATNTTLGSAQPVKNIRDESGHLPEIWPRYRALSVATILLDPRMRARADDQVGVVHIFHNEVRHSSAAFPRTSCVPRLAATGRCQVAVVCTGICYWPCGIPCCDCKAARQAVSQSSSAIRCATPPRRAVLNATNGSRLFPPWAALSMSAKVQHGSILASPRLGYRRVCAFVPSRM